MKLKDKIKSSLKTVSNILYILKLMFKISPVLVIGEILEHIMSVLPSRLISVIGLKFVIDEVQRDGDPVKIIAGVILMIAVLILGELSTSLFFELFVHRERERLDLGIQSLFYKKAAELDMKKYDDPDFYADFILSIENSSDSIKYTLSLVKGYIEEIISFITVSAVMLTIDPVCLLIVLLFVTVFIPMGKYTGKLQIKRREAITEKHRRADYFARVFYLPEYAGEIRTSGILPLLRKRFLSSADEIIATQNKFMKKLDGLFFLQDFTIQAIGFVLVLGLYIGYKTIVTRDMTAGDFVASFNGAVQIGSGVLYLTVYSLRAFTERAEMVEKCKAFLNTESELKDGKTVEQGSCPEEIRLENVSFSYEGNNDNTLDKVSLSIKPGEKIALVGFNGAGKTTLTNLLLRLYDVKDGKITIGGRDIRDATVISHRSRFSAVFQDFCIFSATVGENVALSKDFDEKKVLKALETAGFNKELPDGANTVLLKEFSENGILLSGGEQQKIAIARVFYKNCPYIILDEPSANLDPEAEYKLNTAISEGCRDKTVIFISHRLSTTVHADRIFMLEKGKIIESGSHKELMALNGKYAYMFRLQAEKYNAVCESNTQTANAECKMQSAK
ncbi:MAG: ABC transporter ATP-binding protein [Clostridia bacterium]|nr:ABC transporter ATP-binding protein [Clostridia bacterium]